MAKKQFFIIVDTETTVADTVADFGAVVCDRQGRIVAQCGVLVAGEFDAKELFYDPTTNGFWGKQAAVKRKKHYVDMLNAGSRQLASVAAINRWLAKAQGQYNPTLTAYNLAFDASKCANTQIDLTGFADRFCLWAASVGNICQSKAFKAFALQNHAFNAPTEHGNMTFKTNAEIVAGFLAGEFREEPHTALEDAVDFELPILKHVIGRKGWREKITPYNWKSHQVRDHFAAK